jgi:hypothetical protein
MSTRNPIEVSRNFVVEDGLDVLDIQGEANYAGAFLFKKHLITTHWSKFDGSITQYFVNSPHQQFRSIGEHFYEISRNFIDVNNFEEFALPIIKLFPNGEYRVSIQEFTLDSEFWVAKVASAFGIHHWECYPNADVIVKTLPESDIDFNCVQKWREKIKFGDRPAIILAKSPSEGGFDCYFLVDGHHRLNAYLEEKIYPRAIVIEKLNPSEISAIAFRRLDVLRNFEVVKSFSNQSSKNKISIQDLYNKTINEVHLNWEFQTLEIEFCGLILRFSGVSNYQTQRDFVGGYDNTIIKINHSQTLNSKILELETRSGDKIFIDYLESNLIS